MVVLTYGMDIVLLKAYFVSCIVIVLSDVLRVSEYYTCY
jgi:hypothetical protein